MSNAGIRAAVLSSVSRNAGGLFYSVRGLCKGLHEKGCEPVLFSVNDEFVNEDKPLWAPLPVHVYSGVGPLKYSRTLRRMLATEHPDLVHVHGLWLDTQWAALQYQKKTHTPVVVSPRGMLDPWAIKNAAWKKKAVGRLFANEALRRASCIHVLCEAELQAVRAYGLNNPAAVIPNGVVLPEIKDRMTQDHGKKVLLFLGRIHPKKGLCELLRGWAASGISGSWTLVLAGWDDGGHQSGLERLAGELNISESIVFSGPKFGAEKDDLLRAADAFVLPSYSEGLPMSVLEAWAYALPVLMTGFCNLPEGFGAGAALQIDPEPDSIGEGLQALAQLTDLERAEIGRAGRRLVEERFSWSCIADSMKQVYSWCVHGGNAPKCMVGADG